MNSTKSKYFVVSDVHGNLEGLLSLLENWNEKEEQLIFIGDLVSRGANSLAVIQLVKHLVENFGAICLLGNHERMLDEFLYEPTIYKEYISDYVGGMATLSSFVYDLLHKGYKQEELTDLVGLTQLINEVYPEEVSFIENLKKYHITPKYFFVHAAIENDATQINEISLTSVLWGNQEFYNEPHAFDRIVVFGHMPTQNLKAGGGLFISPCKRKIGIDGGGFFKSEEASINACLLDENKDVIVNYRYYTQEQDIEVEVYHLSKDI